MLTAEPGARDAGGSLSGLTRWQDGLLLSRRLSAYLTSMSSMARQTDVSAHEASRAPAELLTSTALPLSALLIAYSLIDVFTPTVATLYYILPHKLFAITSCLNVQLRDVSIGIVVAAKHHEYLCHVLTLGRSLR
jgi:hypothetical protein